MMKQLMITIKKKYKVIVKDNKGKEQSKINNDKDKENNDRVKDYVSESRGRKLYE